MATETGRVDALVDRLSFQHAHSRRTKVVVLGFTAVLATYGAWLFADLVPRFLTFLLVAAVSAYALYARPTPRGVVIRGLYGLAVCLIATPVVLPLSFLALPYGTSAVSDPVPFVFTVADVVFLLVFGLLAVIPAGIGVVLEWRR